MRDDREEEFSVMNTELGVVVWKDPVQVTGSSRSSWNLSHSSAMFTKCVGPCAECFAGHNSATILPPSPSVVLLYLPTP